MAGDARVPLIVKKMIISWRSFALSMLLCVVVGFSTLAEPLDMFVEAAIGRLGARPVSGDIVVVALDERSLRSEEHTSELQSLMRISYAVFCLKKKKRQKNIDNLETN